MLRDDNDPNALIDEIMALDLTHAWSFGLDEPIYAGGIFEEKPRTWVCWGLATDRFAEIAISLTKVIRRDIIGPLVARGSEHLHSCGLGGYPDIARWMQFLGARQHKCLPRFGKNGEDVIIYKWESADVLRRR